MATCPNGDHIPYIDPSPVTELPPLPSIFDCTDLFRAAAQADAELPPLPPIPTVLGGERVEDVRVRGRYFSRPYVTVMAGEEHVALRIDDEHLGDQWVEITLTTEQVAELLARVMILRPGIEAGALQVLRALSEHLPR